MGRSRVQYRCRKKWIGQKKSRGGCLAYRSFNGRQLSSLVAIVNGLERETRVKRSKKAHRRGDIWLGPLRWLHGERFGGREEEYTRFLPGVYD